MSLGNSYEYICNQFGLFFFLLICFLFISSVVQLQELRRVQGKLFFLPTPPKLQPQIKIAGERSKGSFEHTSSSQTHRLLSLPPASGETQYCPEQRRVTQTVPTKVTPHLQALCPEITLSAIAILPSLSWPNPLLLSRRKHRQKAVWRSLYAKKEDKAWEAQPCRHGSRGWDAPLKPWHNP